MKTIDINQNQIRKLEVQTIRDEEKKTKVRKSLTRAVRLNFRENSPVTLVLKTLTNTFRVTVHVLSVTKKYVMLRGGQYFPIDKIARVEMYGTA